jgi:hypothetical protein
MNRLLYFRLSLGCVLSVAATCGASAQEAESPTRGQLLQQMRQRAAALVVRLDSPADASPISPATEPLLRFGDATRAFHDGTLWIWTERGRPFLMVSVERYEKVWSYELITLDDVAFTLADESGWTWKPRGEPVAEQSPTDAPPPAATAQARQRQSRALSLRFAATEFVGEDRQATYLRLQPRPIHQYQDVENGLLHGAFFVFCNGTNPEVLLILEAVEEGGQGQWRYALARISTAPMQATLDGKQVWTTEPARLPKQQEPYTYYAVPLATTPALEALP